jgi:hypothetical protein
MKLKENLVLREVAGTWVVLPLAAKALDFNGMLSLNETGVMLWHLLESECTKEELVTALLNEYDVSKDVASADVDEFLEILRKAGCLEE